jgi:hypothetical protein
VKSLLAIASKCIIQMLKSGFSALVLAMSVDQEFLTYKIRSQSLLKVLQAAKNKNHP